MEDSCARLIDKLQSEYHVENLQAFLDDDGSKPAKYHIFVNEKDTGKKIGYIVLSIKPQEKTIYVGLVTRYKYGNFTNIYTKGIGKILLYITACQANKYNYTVSFTATPSNGDKLQGYYNSIGFTRNTTSQNARYYKTIIEIDTFIPLIEQTISEFKTKKSLETFKPSWKKNASNQFVIECPECHFTSGTSLSLSHKYDCSNKNKNPDLSEKPAEGGKRKTMKRRKMSKKTIKRK